MCVLTSLSPLLALEGALELSSELGRYRYTPLSTVPSELRLFRRDEAADCTGDDVPVAKLYICLKRRGCGGIKWSDESAAVGMEPKEGDAGEPGVKVRRNPYRDTGVHVDS